MVKIHPEDVIEFTLNNSEKEAMEKFNLTGSELAAIVNPWIAEIDTVLENKRVCLFMRSYPRVYK